MKLEARDHGRDILLVLALLALCVTAHAICATTHLVGSLCTVLFRQLLPFWVLFLELLLRTLLGLLLRYVSFKLTEDCRRESVQPLFALCTLGLNCSAVSLRNCGSF